MDRIVIDNQGRKLRLLDPSPLSKAPEDFQLSRVSRPFRRYFSLVANSLVMIFLVQSFSAQLIGILNGEPLYVIGCSFVTFPCIGVLIFLHRPKLVEVRLLTIHENGTYAHPIPEGGSIQSPMPTRMNRFLVRDDSIIDTPPSFWIWSVFVLCLCISFVVAILEILGGDFGLIISLVLALPMTLILFSIPVYAWWASSNSWIGIPTRLRDAESWLIAGMAAGIPAILVNSWLTPALVPASWSIGTEEFIIYTFSAPIGEELFKFLAVLCFFSYIKGPKTGFQVGFTVGLGFAITENFLYLIMSYSGGGFTALFLTSLIRGIGSIPGHATWTGITGYAIGCYVIKKRWNKMTLGVFDKAKSNLESQWILYNKKSGQPMISSKSEIGPKSIPKWLSAGQEKMITMTDKPVKAIFIAIICHSLWNGSLWFTSVILQDSSLLIQLVANIVTIITLIVLLWIILRRLIPYALEQGNITAE